MALATSDASALVGRQLSVMDSSIWVAVMTGLPAWLQALIILFWIRGSCSGSISTPRSPRATMSASATEIMSSRFSTASGFSILAITGISLFNLASSILIFMMSLLVRTKERAIQSTPIPTQNRRSSRSFSVSEGAETLTWGRLIPFLSLSNPPLTTRQRTLSAAVPITCSSIRPSSSKILDPGRTSRTSPS